MYNPYSLERKTILISGASSGIGRATALECAKLGAEVVITARNTERLKATFDELECGFGQKHQMIVADLSTEGGLDYLLSQVPELDGVSSNAGIVASNKPIKFITDADLQNVMLTNTYSHVRLAKFLFKRKLLKKKASYVFTASIGGTNSFGPGNSTYGMSKAALESFMKYVAIEFSVREIRCNCVNPGMIETPLINLSAITETDKSLDAERYLLKRYGKPEEVARTTAFLLSEASSFITGVSIIVDGGYSVNH